MSLATLTDEDGRIWTVLTATVLFPLRGVWTARIELDADEGDPPFPGSAKLSFAADDGDEEEGPPVELFGTIAEDDIATFEGRATALLVAGAGTFATQALEAKCYQQAPLPVPVLSLVQDAAAEAGEATADIETALSGLTVERWQRAAGRTAAQLLSRLAELFTTLELGWRMNDAGALVVAAEEWPDADIKDAEFFEQGPEDGINRTIAGTVGRASLRPGAVVNGRRIEEVCYELDENGLRVLMRYGAGVGAGGLRGDIEAQTRAAIPPLDYRELHAATVRRQNLDGTLDLDADDARIGGITAVPYCPGIVDCRMVLPEGERVRLGFEGGDERKPFATGWDRFAPPTFAEHQGKGIACRDDAVACGSFTFVGAPDGQGGLGSITVTYSPNVGAPQMGIITPAGTPVQIDIGGNITEASSRVLLRRDT